MSGKHINSADYWRGASHRVWECQDDLTPVENVEDVGVLKNPFVSTGMYIIN